MTRLPPVSIYIVTYLTSDQRCQVLRDTCEWALAQRYPDFEVVVSDNGGSHSAEEALESIDDPRLKVFSNKENEGFTGNINRCLKYCSYDIIKPMCDDDLIHVDFLSHTVPLIDDNTLVVVDVEKFTIGKDPLEIEGRIEPPLTVNERLPGYGRDMWRIPYSSSSIPSAILFTRKLYQRLGGYDSMTVNSDLDFFIEACLCNRIVHVGHILCYVGIWEGSLTEEMLEKPFFYPYEKLYTKFRILHCVSLSRAEDRWLRMHLLKELLWQSLRPLKHINEARYREGCREFYQRFCKLWRQRADEFGRDRICLEPKDPS